jgi:hypothetical protein
MKVRPTRGWLRWSAPILLTGGAAALGYGLALYPIWHRVHEARDVATSGTALEDAKPRSLVLDAYTEESGVAVAGFDKVSWVVPTVMTPFVGYGPAPGRQRNAFISPNQFRGRRELTTPKPPGVIRVFVTGGSVAFGSGAPGDERTIGAYLQSALDRVGARKYEVLTYATPGWLSTHARIAIENRISELQPDLVVWLTGGADLVASESGKNVLWSRSDADQYYWSLANTALKQSGWGQMVDVQDVSPQAVPPEIVASRLRRNVDLAALALSMHNTRLYVFLEPSVITTRKPLSPAERTILTTETSAPFTNRRDYYTRCHERIEAVFRDRKLPANVSYTDLVDVFDVSAKAQTVFVDGFRFGDRGNSVIADAIGKALSDGN